MAPHLWVNAQGPPPALVHRNAVVGGEVVLGQAPDVPLAHLCLLEAQHNAKHKDVTNQ
jgi:hypothetical protein